MLKKEDGDKFMVGIANVDITPKVGLQLSGFLYRQEKPSVGIHDKLFVKALFIKYGRKKVLILTLDLLGVGRRYVKLIRREITKKFFLIKIPVCPKQNLQV